jgi:hypothetical protein
MMTKKHPLLWLIATATLAALYAFTTPTVVNNSVFTLFFPEEKPARPISYDRWLYDSPDVDTSWAKTLVTLRPAVLDTLDPLEERYGDFLGDPNNIIDLKDPSVIEEKVEYDPFTDTYTGTASSNRPTSIGSTAWPMARKSAADW